MSEFLKLGSHLKAFKIRNMSQDGLLVKRDFKIYLNLVRTVRDFDLEILVSFL